jgi:antitoxin ParD1/3/4
MLFDYGSAIKKLAQSGTSAALLRICLVTRRATMNVSLTPELVNYVASQVASGRYSTASELVRAGLRLIQEKETGSPLPPSPKKRNKATHNDR